MQSLIIANQIYISPSIKPQKNQPDLLKADVAQLSSITKSRVDSHQPVVLAGSCGVIFASTLSDSEDNFQHGPSTESIAEEFPFDHRVTSFSYIGVKSKIQNSFQLCALTPHFYSLLQTYLKEHPQFHRLQVVPVLLALLFKRLNPNDHHQFFVVSWNDEREIAIVEHGVIVATITYAQPDEIISLLQNYLQSTEQFDINLTIEAINLESKQLGSLPNGWTFTNFKIDQRTPFEMNDLRQHIPIVTIDVDSKERNVISTQETERVVSSATSAKKRDDLSSLKWILPIVAIIGILLGVAIGNYLL